MKLRFEPDGVSVAAADLVYISKTHLTFHCLQSVSYYMFLEELFSLV